MSIGRPSPCSIALANRLRRIRSTRRGSYSAVAGSVDSRSRISVLLRSASGSQRFDHGGRPHHAGPPEPRRGWPRQRRTARSPGGRPAAPRTGRAGSAAARPSAPSPGRTASRASCSTSAAIRTVVSGVRSSWETSETKRRCTRDRSSSCPILTCKARRHVVERARQPREVVLALDLHAFGEMTGRELLGDRRRIANRVDHLPRDEPADPAEQQHQHQTGEQQGAPHQVERLLLLRERKQVVELGGPEARDGAAARRRRTPAPAHGRRCRRSR